MKKANLANYNVVNAFNGLTENIAHPWYLSVQLIILFHRLIKEELVIVISCHFTSKVVELLFWQFGRKVVFLGTIPQSLVVYILATCL